MATEKKKQSESGFQSKKNAQPRLELVSVSALDPTSLAVSVFRRLGRRGEHEDGGSAVLWGAGGGRRDGDHQGEKAPFERKKSPQSKMVKSLENSVVVK